MSELVKYRLAQGIDHIFKDKVPSEQTTTYSEYLCSYYMDNGSCVSKAISDTLFIFAERDIQLWAAAKKIALKKYTLYGEAKDCLVVGICAMRPAKNRAEMLKRLRVGREGYLVSVLVRKTTERIAVMNGLYVAAERDMVDYKLAFNATEHLMAKFC